MSVDLQFNTILHKQANQMQVRGVLGQFLWHLFIAKQMQLFAW